MTTPWGTATLFRRTAKKRSDSLSNRDGEALPVFDGDAEDPIAYLESIMDDLKGSRV
ncbi:MAG: hypothetical protein JWQ74_821 [Marmoricola sp.]|nr:hypothetical protein [Marmoricola sp.]